MACYGVFQNEHNEPDDPTSSIIEDRKYTQVAFLPDPYYKVSIALQYENLTESSYSKDLNIGFFEVSNGNWLVGSGDRSRRDLSEKSPTNWIFSFTVRGSKKNITKKWWHNAVKRAS